MKNRNYNDDVLFLEDCIDEIFLDIGLEADRLRLAAMANFSAYTPKKGE